MKRRACLTGMLAAVGGAVLPTVALADTPSPSGRPIQLHLDLAVDPAKEQEMLHFFADKFRPAAAQQPGYIDLRMLKLQSVLRGAAPAGTNYQLVMTFASEALRQKWIATEVHRQLWPVMQSSLVSQDYSRLLYEVY